MELGKVQELLEEGVVLTPSTLVMAELAMGATVHHPPPPPPPPPPPAPHFDRCFKRDTGGKVCQPIDSTAHG